MKILALVMVLSLPLFYIFFYEFEPFMVALEAKQQARQQQQLIIDGIDPSQDFEMPAAGESGN